LFSLHGSLLSAGAILLAAGSPISGARVLAQSAGQPPSEYRTVDLRTQLLTGLRVVQPSQVAYVDRVVRTVQQGKMSEAMVQLIYRWSIQRNPRVPFPYFQLAMQALTDRRGIVLVD
jgi:hypothetical protein